MKGCIGYRSVDDGCIFECIVIADSYDEARKKYFSNGGIWTNIEFSVVDVID